MNKVKYLIFIIVLLVIFIFSFLYSWNVYDEKITNLELFFRVLSGTSFYLIFKCINKVIDKDSKGKYDNSLKKNDSE